MNTNFKDYNQQQNWLFPPNDLPTLKLHLNSFEKLYDFLPLDLTADAGYGSEKIQLNQDTCRPVIFIKRKTVRVVH